MIRAILMLTMACMLTGCSDKLAEKTQKIANLKTKLELLEKEAKEIDEQRSTKTRLIFLTQDQTRAFKDLVSGAQSSGNAELLAEYQGQLAESESRLRMLTEEKRALVEKSEPRQIELQKAIKETKSQLDNLLAD